MGHQQGKGDPKQSNSQPINTASKAMPCFKNMATLEREIRDRVSVKYCLAAEKGNDFLELVERIIA